MFKKTVTSIFYGLKIIAMWCLIANLTIFATNLVLEFKAKVTVEQAVLVEQTWDMYPDERAAFDAEMNGRIIQVTVPAGKQVGDTVEVILRDGVVERTVWSDQDYRYVTVPGRIGITLNRSGRSLIFAEGFIFILLTLFLIRSRKEVKKDHPVLIKATHITGLVSAILTAGSWILSIAYSNSWDGFGYAILAFVSYMIYAGIMSLIWIIRVIHKNRKEAR